MSEKVYPKILIVGQTFNKYNGGGITMTNLFTGWPREKMALTSISNIMADLDPSICSNYYQLSYNGKLHPFPLNLVLPKVKCGAFYVEPDAAVDSQELQPIQKPGKMKNLYKAIAKVLHFFGLFNVFYKLKLTPDFLKWVNDFKPDIIYTQLATLETIRFVNDLHEETGIPVCVHMMDDWPKVIDQPGILYHYWKKTTDKELRALLNKSALLMSICDAMSEEYEQRYGGKWVAFHKTIDLSRWLPVSHTDWIASEPFRILYAGRLGVGVVESVVDIINAVNDPSLADCNIVFELQTPNIEYLDGKVDISGRIKSVGTFDYDQIPSRISGADMLVLPHDFDEDSVRFLRFSFSTKITEYMVSGSPVLVYADGRTSLTKYAKAGDWAYVVDKRDKNQLIKAIRDLYTSKEIREKYGKRAKEMAIRLEDSNIVRENFRKAFEEASKI